VTTADGYLKLREAIVSGRLQPSERLVEADLTELLGVSRSAVRTALVRLAQDGLVEHEPNRGAKVRFVPEQEAVEIVEIRAALESLAARHAAERALPADVEAMEATLASMRERLDAGDLLGASDRNPELHARVLAASGHGTVERLVSSLSSQLVRFQYRTILAPGRSERSFEEHGALVAAIRAADPDAAETAMRTHLDHVGEALRQAGG
jgi:DNA-binding GntR family transcriptional regulator